jgi:sulfur carrier protein
MTVLIYLNNKELKTTNGEFLSKVLLDHELSDRSGIAVALNQEVIPKSEWENTVLKNEDKIIIITATAGG